MSRSQPLAISTYIIITLAACTEGPVLGGTGGGGSTQTPWDGGYDPTPTMPPSDDDEGDLAPPSSPSWDGGWEDAGEAAMPDDDPAPEPPEDDTPQPIRCPNDPLEPGSRTRFDLRHDERDRSYVVYVGESVSGDEPVPLVMNFHGANNSPGIQELFSQMNRKADEEGFVVVYPRGILGSFNGGSCCGYGASRDIDDAGFTRAILEDIQERVCVDEERIYATGFSNGGYMSHRLACEMSDVFAAVAPVAGENGLEQCEPGRAVPVIAFHGTADFVIPYSGGLASTEEWAARNGCEEEPTREEIGNAFCDRYSECEGGAIVEMCTLPLWTHLWPSGLSSIAATPRIWDFFERFRLSRN